MGTLLEVKDLKKYFPTPSGVLHAVDGVSFTVNEGETLGVVGESGCGKSTLGRVILHLLDITGGSIYFRGQDITNVSKKELRKLREDMQIIFQDPFSSLNPRMTIAEAIAEPLIISGSFSKAEVDNRVKELMDTVGLSSRLVNTYPHELDGGRRQRIGIARALLCEAEYIIFDEATSSVDLRSENEIWQCINELAKIRTLIIISHRLSTIAKADQIVVMQDGRIVDCADHVTLMQHGGLYWRLVNEQAALEKRGGLQV